jgi:Tn3 transposase DDE domain
VYLERAIAALRGHGIVIEDKALTHLSPIGWEHVNLTGDYTWKAAGRLRKGKFRPLRPFAALNDSVGDEIEIKLLPDGEYDSPMTITRTSGSPNNLFSDVEQARFLLEAIKTCDTALMEVADRASRVEGSDEFHKIRTAVGSVIAEIDQQLISPMLRRHPQLLPEAEKLKIR